MSSVSFCEKLEAGEAPKIPLSSIGQKVHKLLHPDGTTTHVASSPEEAHKLRRTLSAEQSAGVNVVVHGSEEHTAALRKIHSHFDDRRNALREQHGELFKEFEHLWAQMDDIASQLESVEEKDIALDANFSKYGYSATIRAHDTEVAPSSSASSMSGESLSKMYKDRSNQGIAMRFFVQPIVRQYHHKGLIWRARESEEVRSYELFFDLIYVGIIAISGDSTAEEATGAGLLRFAITFIMGWKIWTDVIQIVAWFEADDINRRLSVLLILLLLLGMTTNIYGFLGETYTPAVAFYIAARMATGAFLILYAWLLPMVRPPLVAQIAVILMTSSLWIGSIHADYAGRQTLLWIALMIDVFSNGIIVGVKGALLRAKSDRIRSLFEFFPAINIEHRIERTNAFVSLVFGYSVVSLLYQSSVKNPIDTYFGKAALGLIQAFTFNWLYFEIDSFNLHTHAIRRHVFSSMAWLTLHLPFMLSFVLGAAALTRIVLTHDTESIDALAETSAERSAPEIAIGLRWFYCGGLGTALLSMTAISASHEYRTITLKGSASQWLTKPARLLIRTAIGIVMICLGLAKALNSLQLIATTTCLMVLALAIELWANTIFCDGPKHRGRCSYSARCQISKKDLEEGVKDGTIATVSELEGEKGSVFLT